MTNDDLNRWYEEIVLGKCGHHDELIYSKRSGITHCPNCTNAWAHSRPIRIAPIHDYLSDPAVILGIIVEHGICINRCDCWPPGTALKRVHVGDNCVLKDAFGEGVMVELKAKVEQKEKAIA